MASFEPPPTYAMPVLINKETGESSFSPLWLKWFLDLTGVLSISGASSGGIVHNNLSGLQGGSSGEYYHLTSTQHGQVSVATASTYSPTLSNTTNVSASTAYQCQYLRVGATVVVSGRVDVDPTAAGQVVLGISLPVASNFGADEDCAGAAAAIAVAGQSAGIHADTANDRALLEWIAVDTANRAMYFTFAYQVI
jgi:hypothetical protein